MSRSENSTVFIKFTWLIAIDCQEKLIIVVQIIIRIIQGNNIDLKKNKKK